MIVLEKAVVILCVFLNDGLVFWVWIKSLKYWSYVPIKARPSGR